ncbi:MAG: tetratricopeptide repeat protein [Halobacteriota archaeon]|jgi:Flp pilus assembly protein TadD
MGSVDDYISQATDLLNKDDIAAAILMYREALKIDPKDPTALTGLGTALNESGELESAIDCFNKALEADPDDVIARSGLGVAYEKKGNTSRAMREYRSALSLDEETAFLHIAYARDRYEKSLLKEKEELESKAKALEELIGRYVSTIKAVDRSIAKFSPK